MTTLPYENATSGKAAMAEIEKLIQRFGCSSFGHMTDFEKGELLIQFRWRDYPISVRSSFKGYAAAWLRAHPHTRRMRGSKAEHERKALKVAEIAVYSILRDWIKGQLTAIETGILTFEGAFLGQILLPTGETVLERVAAGGGILALPKPDAAR